MTLHIYTFSGEAGPHWSHAGRWCEHDLLEPLLA